MRTSDYWDRKISVYLHDPPDKALGIAGHKERAARLREIFGAGRPDESALEGDWIASALDRAMTPGYSRDLEASGAVDFLSCPVLTHPTGNGGPSTSSLTLDLSPVSLGEVNRAMEARIRKDLDRLSENWKGDYEGFSRVKLHYLHLVLSRRLATCDCGGLGGLWRRLPADTRIPDHSIWQHNGLVSALQTCQEEGNGPVLFVYSLAPVQGMIAKARKLRDFWTGSVLVSWLAFEGIRAVMEHWGPDHVVYPSLADQPLVDAWLERFLKFRGLEADDGGLKGLRDPRVASFPNKFVALIPAGREEETARGVRKEVEGAWEALDRASLNFLVDRLYDADGVDGAVSRLKERFPEPSSLLQVLRPQFRKQGEGFWEHQWAAAPLPGPGGEGSLRELLGGAFPESLWKYGLSSLAVSPYRQRMRHEACGAFYPVAHQLVQTCLAATKATRLECRPVQEGLRCSVDPELSVLTVEPGENPAPREDLLWAAVREVFNPAEEGSETAVKESERLSAASLVKRFAHEVSGRRELRKDYVLDSVFGQGGEEARFESTTEMALKDWLDRHGIRSPKARRAVAQSLHDSSGEEVEDQSVQGVRRRLANRFPDFKKKWEEPRESERYYAFVVMDGDKMGELVNGASLASRWDSVMHPELAGRMGRNVEEGGSFEAGLVKHWKEFLHSRRALSPALHASVSEALGDFSIYGVSSIAARRRGRLIYAGGDDVCAVFPVSEVIQAVLEVERLYRSAFLSYEAGSEGLRVEVLDGVGKVVPRPGKLSVNLGKGPGLTLSAGVVLAHHKASLGWVYGEAQRLLKEEAKNGAGRSAMALSLVKRSGVPRTVTYRFTDARTGEPLTCWPEFLELARKVGHRDLRVLQASGSLLYRLQDMREGIEPLVSDFSAFRKFVAHQLERSGLSGRLWPRKEERERESLELAGRMARLCIVEGRFRAEPLLVARFLGERLALRGEPAVGEEGGASS